MEKGSSAIEAKGKKELCFLKTGAEKLNVTERVKQAINQTLSVEDLLDAEISIILYSQQKRLKEEIAALSVRKPVSRDGSVYKLDKWTFESWMPLG